MTPAQPAPIAGSASSLRPRFLNGNGGPMQTIGYMMGNMQVVS